MNWPDQVYALRAVAGILHGSRAFGGPLQANVNLTNRCNIRCVHCYFHSPLVEKPNLFELRRARRSGAEAPDRATLHRLLDQQADTGRMNALIDRLLAMGTRRFQFSGNGETFTHPDAIEFMARAKRKGAHCIANTNGTPLTREKMDALLAMGFDDLRVTVMAGDGPTYSRTHPGCAEAVFDRLKENLLHLSERKAACHARKPKLSLAYVIVAQNADGLMNFARLAVETKAEQVIFRVFDDVEDPGFATVTPSAEQSVRIKQQLGEARLLLDQHAVRHNVPNVLQVFHAQLNTTALYRLIPCFYGWLAARFDVSGEVHPCCRCYTPLGNAFEQDFAEIWHDEAYNRFRHEAIRINRRLTPVAGCDCDSCPSHNANLRVYRALHPIRGRLPQLRRVCPAAAHDE